MEGHVQNGNESRAASERKEWYLEYQIHRNRPGLLGDLSSVLGMLKINIITINGVDINRRGLLFECDDDQTISLLRTMMDRVKDITITKLREPRLRDRLAVRHGRYIERDADDRKTFRFVRTEIGLLVDFMAELFNNEGHQLIGVRGQPRVGKTESMIASSVAGNKRWSFVSSTLLRQTMRSQMAEDERSADHVFIIDGIVSTLRASEKHQMLLREILRLPATKVVEHPDIFVQHTEYELEDFDYLIELRNHADEEIQYEFHPELSSFDMSDWR